MINKKNILVGLLIALIAFVSCGKKEKTSAPKADNIDVTVSVVKVTAIPMLYNFTGKVAAREQSTLSTRLMGQITDVFVEEGDVVTKGTLLLKIRSNDIRAKKQQVQASIDEATAANVVAQKDFVRVTTLFEKKSATQKELDDITAYKAMAEARLSAAQKMKSEVNEMMQYANIKAPFDGVITDKFIYSGDMANPGMPLIALESHANFEVITQVPESELLLCEPGDAVNVRIKSGNLLIHGEIAKVSPSNKNKGPQYEAVIYLNPSSNDLLKLRSGMFANVELNKGVTSTIMVDKKLIIKKGQLSGIWTVTASQQAMMRWVRLGRSVGDKVEVLSGLAEGDTLIKSYNGRLINGTSVSIGK